MKHHTVWINGRFLSRKVTGVERVAHEVLRALDSSFLDSQASCVHNGVSVSFKIAAPASPDGSLPDRLGRIPVCQIGSLTGHAWEQFSLSRWAHKDWLLNLCNTAPIWRRRQSIFIHDAQVFAIPRNFSWRFRLWYQLLLQVSGRRSLGLFTNSHFSRKELCKFTGIREGKIAVVHLGADHMHRLAASIPGELLAQIPARPFLLAVSSASPNKNFKAVIEAVRILGDQAPPCVFVGQKCARVFGGSATDASRVTELGYVSDETLAALYARTLCLVYPSFYEGFGLPPLEAMAFGAPVVVSNTSSLPEVCADAAIYCDPSSPESLAKAIAALQADPGRRRESSLAGKARAAEFTWKLSAEKMLDALCATLQLNDRSTIAGVKENPV